ncbi:flavin reductase [Glutamicibacter arilaitensis]|uniref:flavin reductase n=1 Tax=Glutamicibacter arilaitensis TaxID=256701 RepID=UPI0038509A62
MDDVKSVLRCHPSIVAVITADMGGRPVALTTSTVASLSAADPPLLFCGSGRQSLELLSTNEFTASLASEKYEA